MIDELQKSGLEAKAQQALDETKLLNENNMSLQNKLDAFANDLKG